MVIEDIYGVSFVGGKQSMYWKWSDVKTKAPPPLPSLPLERSSAAATMNEKRALKDPLQCKLLLTQVSIKVDQIKVEESGLAFFYPKKYGLWVN